MQTRLESFLEAAIGVGIGIVTSMLLSHWLFPAVGAPITFKQNATITGAFTLLSLVRTYYVRRMFNKFHLRDKIKQIAAWIDCHK